MSDWNPDSYGRYTDVRLQPALDLLHRIANLPKGPVVDLGCGNGAVAASLHQRWPDRGLTGIDNSPAMLARADERGAYSTLQEADIANWQPDTPPALIFSNAALQWVPDHAALLPRLAGLLARGGTLAVQMPYQHTVLSHTGWGQAEETVLGHRRTETALNALTPDAYFDLLSPLGEFRLWQTEYLQHLAATPHVHPVRLFTESTFGKPFLDNADSGEKAQLIEVYERAMAKAYPLRKDGSVLFPFRRLFFTLRLT